MNKINNFGVAIALLAVLLWSTVAVVFKLGLRVYSSFELLLYSACFSTLTLLVLLLFSKRNKISYKIDRRNCVLSLLQGLLNPFFYYILLFTAYERMPAQIAQPINFTWPIFLTVFAALLLKEKVTKAMYAALIISFVGVLVISLGSSNIEGDYKHMSGGVLFCVMSAIVWAFYWIISAKDPRPPMVKLFWAFASSLLYILLYGSVTKQMPTLTISMHLVYPVYIGLFEMSITFLLWLVAIQKGRGTPLLANLAYLVPVISLFFIRMFLKEEIQPSTIIGLFFITAGVLIQAQIRRKF